MPDISPKVMAQIEENVPMRGCTYQINPMETDIRYFYLKFLYTPANIDFALSMNCNYIQIVVWPIVMEDGQVIECHHSMGQEEEIGYSAEDVQSKCRNAEKILTRLIDDAHDQGLKVYLILYPERVGSHDTYGHGLKNRDRFIKELEPLIWKWAEIAEEHNVELFSPVNELFLFIGIEEANKWHKDNLPRLKELYSDDLAPRGLQFFRYDPLQKKVVETRNTEFDFSGWDYIASDFYCGGVQGENLVFDPAELEKCIIATIKKSHDLKEEYGAKGVFYGEVNHAGTIADVIDLDALDMFLRESYGRVDGWFMWWVDAPDADKRITELFKSYFVEQKQVSDTPLEMPELSDPEGIASRMPVHTEVIFEEQFEDEGFISTGDDYYRLPDRFQKDLGDSYTLTTGFKIMESALRMHFEWDPISDQNYEVNIGPLAYIRLASPEFNVFVEDFLTVERNRWYELKISRHKNDFAIYLDSKLLYAFTDPNPLTTGRVDLGHPDKEMIFPEGIVIYRDIKVLKSAKVSIPKD